MGVRDFGDGEIEIMNNILEREEIGKKNLHNGHVYNVLSSEHLCTGHVYHVAT